MTRIPEEVLQQLEHIYKPVEIPKCHICGEELRIRKLKLYKVYDLMNDEILDKDSQIYHTERRHD